MKVKLHELKACLFYVVILVLNFFVLYSTVVDNSNYAEVINISGIVVIINFLSFLLLSNFCNIKIYSPISVFIIFAYIFHFGQLVLEAFPIYEYQYDNYFYYMSRDVITLAKTLNISINTINIIFLGALLNRLFVRNKTLELCNVSYNESILEIRKLGEVLIIVTTPLRILVDATRLIGAFYGGYGATWDMGLGFISTLADIWYSAIIFLYIGYSDNKRKQRLILISSIAYVMLSMLSGNRGRQVVALCVIMLVVLCLNKVSIRLRSFIKYGFICYILLIFLNIIFDMRKFGIAYLVDNYSELIYQALSKNMLLETLGVFGETLYTPFLMLQQYGETLKPFFGEGIIYSIPSLVPNIGGVFDYYNTASIYQKMIGTNHTIGGSFVGDLYYNFGDLSYLFALLFGIYLSNISDRFETCLENKNYLTLVYILPIILYSIWWVRDSVGNIMRPIVWQIIICVLILQLINNRRARNR